MKGKIQKGCLIREFEDEVSPIVLIHGINTFDLFRSGVAAQLEKNYGIHERIHSSGLFYSKYYKYASRSQFRYGDKNLLGSVVTTNIQPQYDKVIVNAYTQRHPSDKDKRTVSYDAVADCFETIKKNLHLFTSDKDSVRIIYPRIGAGVANGQWSVIKEIIDYNFRYLNHTLIIQD